MEHKQTHFKVNNVNVYFSFILETQTAGKGHVVTPCYNVTML